MGLATRGTVVRKDFLTVLKDLNRGLGRGADYALIA